MLIAQDGCVMMRPRFKLIPVDDPYIIGARENNIVPYAKFATTIVGKWNGNVEKILEYYPKTNKYKVQFVVPGGEPYIDIIPASYLRGSIPTKMSDLEREFFAKETS